MNTPIDEFVWAIKGMAIVTLFGFAAHVMVKLGSNGLPFAFITLGLSLGIVFAETLGKIIDRRG